MKGVRKAALLLVFNLHHLNYTVCMNRRKWKLEIRTGDPHLILEKPGEEEDVTQFIDQL